MRERERESRAKEGRNIGGEREIGVYVESEVKRGYGGRRETLNWVKEGG